jgi:DNA-binding NtrC family response regulator
VRSAGKKSPRARGGAAAFQKQIERVITTFVDRAAVTPRRPATGRRTNMTLQEATKRFQLEFVHRALEEHRIKGRWNISAAARALGVSRSLLYKLADEMPRAKRSLALSSRKRSS